MITVIGLVLAVAGIAVIGCLFSGTARGVATFIAICLTGWAAVAGAALAAWWGATTVLQAIQ